MKKGKRVSKGLPLLIVRKTCCTCLVAGERAAGAAAPGRDAGVVAEGHAFLRLELLALGAGAVRLEHVRKSRVVQRPRRRRVYHILEVEASLLTGRVQSSLSLAEGRGSR